METRDRRSNDLPPDSEHTEMDPSPRPQAPLPGPSAPAPAERTPGLRGYGDLNWSNAGPLFRSVFTRRFTGTDTRWEDVEPAYRYAYEMSRDPRFKGREFADIEADMRSDYLQWAQRHGYGFNEEDGSGWERLREHVRAAWEQAQATGRRAA